MPLPLEIGREEHDGAHRQRPLHAHSLDPDVSALSVGEPTRFTVVRLPRHVLWKMNAESLPLVTTLPPER